MVKMEQLARKLMVLVGLSVGQFKLDVALRIDQKSTLA